MYFQSQKKKGKNLAKIYIQVFLTPYLTEILEIIIFR